MNRSVGMIDNETFGVASYCRVVRRIVLMLLQGVEPHKSRMRRKSVLREAMRSVALFLKTPLSRNLTPKGPVPRPVSLWPKADRIGRERLVLVVPQGSKPRRTGLCFVSSRKWQYRDVR